MKRLATIAIIALLSGSGAHAYKEKITERSDRRIPEWLGQSSPEWFSVSATAATLDAAQKQCLNDIRQFIVNSIAVNIVSSETLFQNQTSKNGITNVLQSYSSQTDTKAAAIPYLSGISLSNAESVYWERRMVKSEKRSYYIFHVKYPFTSKERDEAIANFKKTDAGYTRRLEELKNTADTFEDMGYTDYAITELNSLAEYFFDDARRREAEILRSKYRNMKGEVAIEAVSSAPGEFRYRLVLHGRSVTTDRQPQLTSEYATNMRTEHDSLSYILRYDELGIEGEENTIDIRYSFGGRQARYTVRFDPSENKISVRPFGTATIEYGANEGGSNTATARIWLRSRTANDFVIKDAEIRIPEMSVLKMPQRETVFSGQGEHLFSFISPASATGAFPGAIAEIYLKIFNPKTGEENDMKYYLPYKLIK